MESRNDFMMQNESAQARRGKDIQPETEAGSRRCLKPLCWTKLSCVKPARSRRIMWPDKKQNPHRECEESRGVGPYLTTRIGAHVSKEEGYRQQQGDERAKHRHASPELCKNRDRWRI